MNEWTNILLYKNISLTLYSRKGWFWLCVRGELKTGTDSYILTQVLLTIEALLLILAGVAQSWVTESPKPSVCRWLSLRHFVANWLKPLCAGYIIVLCPPASAVLLLIYTGASLDWQLGRGSICYNMIEMNMASQISN